MTFGDRAGFKKCIPCSKDNSFPCLYFEEGHNLGISRFNEGFMKEAYWNLGFGSEHISARNISDC